MVPVAACTTVVLGRIDEQQAWATAEDDRSTICGFILVTAAPPTVFLFARGRAKGYAKRCLQSLHAQKNKTLSRTLSRPPQADLDFCRFLIFQTKCETRCETRKVSETRNLTPETIQQVSHSRNIKRAQCRGRGLYDSSKHGFYSTSGMVRTTLNPSRLPWESGGRRVRDAERQSLA